MFILKPSDNMQVSFLLIFLHYLGRIHIAVMLSFELLKFCSMKPYSMRLSVTMLK